jgi:hypothetical protein
MAVSAGEADGGLAVRSDGSDQRFVDAAGEDHEGGIAGLGVGDAKTGDELALLAHLCEGTGQLHTTAVNDGDLIPVGDKIGNGFAGGMKDLLIFKGDTA